MRYLLAAPSGSATDILVDTFGRRFVRQANSDSVLGVTETLKPKYRYDTVNTTGQLADKDDQLSTGIEQPVENVTTESARTTLAYSAVTWLRLPNRKSDFRAGP